VFSGIYAVARRRHTHMMLILLAERLGGGSPDRWQAVVRGLVLLLAGMNAYVLVAVLRPAHPS
jgi:hypothetical protein